MITINNLLCSMSDTHTHTHICTHTHTHKALRGASVLVTLVGSADPNILRLSDSYPFGQVPLSVVLEWGG